jgi:hypothetical protein
MTCDKRFYLRYSRVKAYDPEVTRRDYAQGRSSAGGGSGKTESGKAESGKAA